MDAKLLDKIAKLKRHAESAAQIGNQAEAEAFAAKVQDVLLRHKLDQSEVDRALLDAADPMQRRQTAPDEFSQTAQKRRVLWSEDLAAVVAAHHFCVMAVQPKSNGVTFYGRASDVEICVFMFVYLARAAARLCAEEITRRKADYYRTKPRTKGVKPQWKHRVTKRLWPGDKRFAASFHIGFRAAIAARYEAQRKAAEVSDQALILRRSDADAAEFAAEFTRAATALKKVKIQDAAAFAGWREGQKVDLGLKGVKTSRPVGLLGE